MTVRIKITVLSLRQKATRDDRMGLVKTRRLAAMQKQQRAKAVGFEGQVCIQGGK